MVSLLLIFLVLGLGLIGLLVAGSLFLHGYFYTETNVHLFWQAPIAGIVLTGFCVGWCMLNVRSEGATVADFPYDVFFRATWTVDLADKPFKKFQAYETGKKDPIEYVLRKEDRVSGNVVVEVYRKKGGRRNDIFRSQNVEAIVIEHGDRKIRLKRQPESYDASTIYVSDDGWYMADNTEGVLTQPQATNMGRFCLAMLINLGHFALWLLCLWQLMRFHFWHAFGLAIVLWGVMTLIMMNVMDQAAALV